MTVYNYTLHDRTPSLFTKYFPVQSYPSPGAEGSDESSVSSLLLERHRPWEASWTALVVKEEDRGPAAWVSPDLTDLIC